MNATFKVASLFDCDELSTCAKTVNTYDPIWRQTVVGCRILQILKDMYGFKIYYIIENTLRNLTVVGEEKNFMDQGNQTVDIYLRPKSFGLHNVDYVYPVLAAYKWRFGFILRQSCKDYYKFYSKPFTRSLWHCLYSMALLVSIFLYFLKKWEFGIVGGWESSYSYEILMVIGAYCQHIPPMDATLPSRRIAYFIFFIFAYTIYAFYTSNLLSNIVNVKKLNLSLQSLAASSFELVIVDYMKLMLTPSVPSNSHNYTIIINKLRNLRSVSVEEGIKGMTEGKMALLSDYISLYPYAKSFSARQVLCEIYSIDLFSKIQKYFFVSNEFPYKEEFKIGAMRATEAGLLKNFVNVEVPTCEESNVVHTDLQQISIPLFILFGTYFVCVLMLFAEKIWYKRTKVWPFVN